MLQRPRLPHLWGMMRLPSTRAGKTKLVSLACKTIRRFEITAAATTATAGSDKTYQGVKSEADYRWTTAN